MSRPARNIFVALEVLFYKRQGWTELMIAKKYGWAISKGENDPEWKKGSSTVRRYAKSGRKFLREYLEVYRTGVLLCFAFVGTLLGFDNMEFNRRLDSIETDLDMLQAKLRIHRRKYRKFKLLEPN